MKNSKGFTLVELIVVVTIIGIIAMIGIPAYLGQQSRAARSEAYSNLETLRLLQEQFFSENASYAASAGVCAADNDNTTAIQGDLPGFQPGVGLNFSYCIEMDVNLAGAAATNCFRARAFGNTNSRNPGEIYAIDCTNNKNY